MAIFGQALYNEFGGFWRWTLNAHFDISLAGNLAIPDGGYRDLGRLADCNPGGPARQGCRATMWRSPGSALSGPFLVRHRPAGLLRRRLEVPAAHGKPRRTADAGAVRSTVVQPDSLPPRASRWAARRPREAARSGGQRGAERNTHAAHATDVGGGCRGRTEVLLGAGGSAHAADKWFVLGEQTIKAVDQGVEIKSQGGRFEKDVKQMKLSVDGADVELKKVVLQWDHRKGHVLPMPPGESTHKVR